MLLEGLVVAGAGWLLGRRGVTRTAKEVVSLTFGVVSKGIDAVDNLVGDAAKKVNEAIDRTKPAPPAALKQEEGKKDSVELLLDELEEAIRRGDRHQADILRSVLMSLK